ncbi:MAG: hypothetical protein PVI78_05670 [Anaerolineales bacterium]|jgi:hypothetical protein
MDDVVYEILDLVAYLIRALGSLAFGFGMGWLVLKIIKGVEKHWPLALASLLGLLGAFVVLAGWGPSSATVGSFGLGAGAAIIVWGLIIKPEKDDD